ncbi:MAG: hypothetical protein WCT41_03770 [Candidatus Paceibacterota bacterium]|jgi:hypothetical protein
MSVEWNRVTWYSKLLAVVVFLAAFIVAFNLGILYQQASINATLLVVPNTTVTASSTTETIPSTIRISASSTTDAAASTTAATASTTDIQIGGGAGAH